VAATFDDQVFNFTDGACVKIIRKWTVLDWCQFNPSTGKGKWEKLQVIKINNSVSPTILSACKDTTFCVYNAQCGADLYTQIISATDDCHADTFLTYYWTVDKDNNGDIDTFSHSPLINILLAPGKHKVFCQVTDECGNITTCSYFVLAKDCKKPSPYCLSAISSVIMPSTGELTIKAKSLNLNSFDNCTPAHLLKYSFSADIRDTLKSIKCSDIDNGVSQSIPIDMWVTDMNGNNDFCTVNLTIADNNQVCQDPTSNFSISGTIYNIDQTKLFANTLVDIRVEDTEFRFQARTNQLGLYNHDNLPGNFAHIIKPLRNDSIQAGLSTIDLIQIQKHILGAAPFNNPYKIIAADADGNKKISVSDLVAIKKVILGVSNTFPQNKNCWTFVEKNHHFANASKPLNYPDSIRLNKLFPGNNNANDFIGIKIGDVNNSYTFLKNQNLENRSINYFVLQKVEEGREYFLNFGDDITMTGMQLSLKTDTRHVEFNAKFKNDIFYEFKDGYLLLIYLPSTHKKVEKGEWLLKLNEEFYLSENFQNEIYDNALNEIKINIEENSLQNTIVEEEKLNIQVMNENVIITSNFAYSKAQMEIYDVLGRRVHHENIEILEGHNQWSIPSMTREMEFHIIKIRYANRVKVLKIIN
jgi:hypothetical protein